MAAYASSTSQLLALAGGDAAKVTEALNAGAYEIDSAFAAAGYAVPLVTTSMATELKARLDAKLSVVNTALAAFALSAGSGGKKGTPDKVAKDYAEAMKWLDRVRSGEAAAGGQLADLPTVSTEGRAFDVAGSTEWPFNDDLIDTTDIMVQ